MNEEDELSNTTKSSDRTHPHVNPAHTLERHSIRSI